MFKCSECGQKFEIKPDYCDCGNDTFEEVVVEKIEEPTKTEEKIVEKSESFEKFEKPITQSKSTPPKSKKDIDPPVDVPSLIIFVGCILLSLFVVFFAWSDKVADVVQSEEKTEKVEKNIEIPSIDKIWDSTVNKMPAKQEQQEVQQQAQQPVQQQAPQPVQQVVVQPKVERPTPIKNKVEDIKKQMQQKQTQTQKINSQKIQQKAQQKPQATVQKTQVKPQTKPVTTTVQQTVKPSQVNTAVKKASAQELANYKIGLRNKIASRINFANVLGDGTCTVVFKVSSTGALTNRKFSVQSDNGMLNDAVYQAILSVPSYKTPPSNYNGEYLRFVVRFYNDNFEISLN